MCSGINIPINQSDFGAKYRIRARVGVQTTFLSTNNFCYSDCKGMFRVVLPSDSTPTRPSVVQ